MPGYIQASSIALSPDGRELAAVVLGPHGPDGPYRISVIATSTGRMRTWTWRGPLPRYLAWSGDHHVDFIATPQDGGSRLVRLSTSAPAQHSAFRVLVGQFSQFGSLARWSPWWVDGLTVTPDGRTAFAALDGGDVPHLALLRLSATTGRPLQVLARPWAGPPTWSGQRRGIGLDHPDQGPDPGLQLLMIADPVQRRLDLSANRVDPARQVFRP